MRQLEVSALHYGHPDLLEALVDRSVGMVEAKSKLAELVGQVKYGGRRFVLERHGQAMAVLISLEEYEQLCVQASAAAKQRPPDLSPELRRRQAILLERAEQLRRRNGPPEDRLADLLADLPPDDDDFWHQVQEAR